MPQFPFKFFNKNPHGKDYVVGDLHGMFSLMEAQLERIGFNSDVDRLFSVGDLIDRGPESHRILEFLDLPWFHAIKGNHEMMMLEAKHRKTNYRSWIVNNGGEWWEDVDFATRDLIRTKVRELPVAMEITSDIGKIGIVHADVPVGLSWQKIVHSIHYDNEVRDYLMWSRNRYKYIQLTGETETVEGIDLVIMGHTPISKPLRVSNVFYIDTGASYIEEEDLGHLTMVQIHPTLEVYQYPEPLD